MLRILDKYILKQYLSSFFLLLGLFVPIMITVHIAEKVNKIIANNVPLPETLEYLLNFTIVFSNFLFPLFLFISTMFFTSRIANNTEVIAFLSSGVSFNRFLRPYIIGASIICIAALVFSSIFVPSASAGFNEFQQKFFKNEAAMQTSNVYRQINDSDYVYVSNYQSSQLRGFDFTLEHFKDNKLAYKIYANYIQWQDSIYVLSGYKKRVITEYGDIITKKARHDTIFDFDIEELTPTSYIAETLQFDELNDFIAKEESRGNANMNIYYVEKYKRFAIPVSAFIFTLIAVAVSSVKKRGGMGINIAIGLVIAMSYMFLDKIFGTIAEQSDFSPLLAVWIPNATFALVAVLLIRNARR